MKYKTVSLKLPKELNKNNRKLSEDDILYCKDMIFNGSTVRSLSKHFEVSDSTIRRYCIEGELQKQTENVLKWKSNNKEKDREINIRTTKNRMELLKQLGLTKEWGVKTRNLNKEPLNKYAKEWRNNNPDYLKEYSKEWRIKNPDYRKNRYKEKGL